MGAYSVTVTTSTNSTEVAGGGVTWTNPQYASVNDGTNFASASFAGLDLSNWIDGNKFTTWPAWTVHHTITGLSCNITGQCDNDSSCYYTHCTLSSLGAYYAGSDLSNPKPIELSFKELSVGGDGEMWGLTSDQIKTFTGLKFGGFQFEVEELAGLASNVDVDGMTMTVWYDIRPKFRNLLGCGI